MIFFYIGASLYKQNLVLVHIEFGLLVPSNFNKFLSFVLQLFVL